MEQAEAYLTTAGWECCGRSERGDSIWRDPLGSHARAMPVVYGSLPNKEGQPTEIKQMTGQPIPWDYSLIEAVQRQRERDAAGGVQQSPLDRLHIAEKELGDVRAKYTQLVETLHRLTVAPLPEKRENIMLQRNQIVQAIASHRRELGIPRADAPPTRQDGGAAA